MSEVIIVTWAADQVELRQISSEGVWQPNVPPIRTIELNRPTRLDRLSQIDSGGGFHQALIHLFSDVEISLPVWLLMPNLWVQSFHVENPNLQTDEMQRSHFLWEAQQRISSDISSFKVHLPSDLTQPKPAIHMVRDEILELYNREIRKAGIEIAGIWVEPEWGTEYNFEMPSDFRDAVPADLIDIIPAKHPTTVPQFVPIIVGVAVLALAGYIWQIPSGEKPPRKTRKVQEKPEMTVTMVSPDSMAAVETDVAESELKPIPGASPVSQLVKALPSGTDIVFAVISPVDCKVEISGLQNVTAWLNNLKRSATFKSAQVAGTYTISGKSVSVIRLSQTGWQAGVKTKTIGNWEKLASSKGMKPSGRSAVGDYSAALALVDAVWSEPGGFEKVYLAPDKGRWVVTVQ